MLDLDKDDYVARLFPTLVYKFGKYGKVSSNVFDCSKELEMLYDNQGNYTTENSYILDLPHYKLIKDRIMEGLKIYTQKVLGLKPYNFYITQSWVNVTIPNGYHHEHKHANSIISGVYYIDCGEGLTESETAFSNPNPATLGGSDIWALLIDQLTTSNSREWVLPASNNDIIYFPSALGHSVKCNQAKTNRISLSFNTFIKGTIGNKLRLSELKL
jgi:uncharacterized protein (TIGR02466 family)